jgi:hypothetical protein
METEYKDLFRCSFGNTKEMANELGARKLLLVGVSFAWQEGDRTLAWNILISSQA